MSRFSLVKIPSSETKESLLFSNKDLFRLIWPLVIEQLLNITLGIADIMMVSSLGEASVSGVALVDAIMILIIQVFAALGTGGAVVASQYIGHKDEKNAGKTANQLIYTLVIISSFLVVIGLVSRFWLLPAIFGAIDADVMAASQRYFFWTLFSLPGIALYSGCAALFRAQGNSRISMFISVLINIINIGGNAFFLFVLHWDVVGVAIPTLISRLSASVILLVLLYGAKEYHGRTAISIRGISHLHLDLGIVKKILSIGIPNGLENGIFQVGKLIVLSLIATFGTTAIAANAAGNTMAMLETLPAGACGLAMLTVVGQCLGAEKPEQAVYFSKKLLFIAYILIIIWNVPLLLCSEAFLGLYGLEPETTRLAWLMGISHGTASMLFWPLAFALPFALRAAGDATFTMIVSIASMAAIRVGCSYVFKYTGILGLVDYLNWPMAFGAMGVWFSMTLDWIVRSIFFVIRFLQGKWKTKKLI